MLAPSLIVHFQLILKHFAGAKSIQPIPKIEKMASMYTSMSSYEFDRRGLEMKLQMKFPSMVAKVHHMAKVTSTKRIDQDR